MYTLVASAQTVGVFSGSNGGTVLLIGGFMGHWNFGDMLQLRSSLAHHRNQIPGALLIPIVNIMTVASQADIACLENVFSLNSFAFFCRHDSAEENARAQSLHLVPIPRPGPNQAVALHVYGGGTLNGFWGNTYLEIIESVLVSHVTGKYVVSGQQVDPTFADSLAAHCRICWPEVFGCRDDRSVALLRSRGVTAHFSGDDAIDELARFTSPDQVLTPESGWTGRFAVHLNLTDYVWANASDEPEFDTTADRIGRLNAELAPLRQTEFLDVEPLVIGALAESDLSLADSLVGLKKTNFTRWFPRVEFINLAGSVMAGRLERDVLPIRACAFVASTSYHVALLGTFLGVPTYLFSFNGYYRHKKESLGERVQSLSEFIADGPRAALNQQTEFLRSLRGKRAIWCQEHPLLLAATMWQRSAEAGLEPVAGPRLSPALAAQLKAERIARDQDATNRQLRDWIARIEEGKAWLEQQRAAWQKTAMEQEQVIRDLRATLERLDGHSA